MITGKLNNPISLDQCMTYHSKLYLEQSGKALSSHFSRIAPSSDNILNYMTEAIPKVLFKVLISRSLPSLHVRQERAVQL